jgi:RNA polymerase sigma-70 factor (ECF subfamily)
MFDNKRKEFDAIFRKTYSRLYFYALSLLSDESDAEDVVEEVFVELWRRRDELEWGDKLGSFLYRAIYTRSLNMIKRNGKSTKRLNALNDINAKRMEWLSGMTQEPTNNMEDAELRRAINNAIDELPQKCGRVFRMSYLNGMRNKDIAEEMELSVRTVEAHMYNALQFLRKRLKQFLT